MHNKELAFGPLNYIVLAAGIAIAVIGLIMMSGNGTTEEAFNPDIFSDMRIKVAPITTLLGFVVVIAAILIKPKRNNKE